MTLKGYNLYVNLQAIKGVLLIVRSFKDIFCLCCTIDCSNVDSTKWTLSRKVYKDVGKLETPFITFALLP